MLKPVILHPKAREAIRAFPREVRNRLGRSLFRLQMGEALGMPQSRPMPNIAAGASELRARGHDGIYRAFYYTAARGVLVFHAFVKKTEQTPTLEVSIARVRLKELLDA